MSETNYIFSPEELLHCKRQSFQLPQRGGPKDFAPDGTQVQETRVQCMLGEYESLLKEQRVIKKGTVSVGIWNAERKVAEITTEKGPFWQHFGRKIAGQMELLPEEALYLVEQGYLELFYEGLPLSFQQAYTMLLPQAFPFEHYLVYSYLLRLGFIVLRHKTRSSSEEGNTSDVKAQASSSQKVQADMSDSPLLNGPVSHLWTDKEGCVPLVQPSDATSTASVLSKLQVVKTHRMKENSNNSVTSHNVAFDVYQPGVHFKKTSPGLPYLCISVCQFSSAPPSLAVTSHLTQECCPVPLKFAVVDGASISFYGFLDVDNPIFVR